MEPCRRSTKKTSSAFGTAKRRPRRSSRIPASGWRSGSSRLRRGGSCAYYGLPALTAVFPGRGSERTRCRGCWAGARVWRRPGAPAWVWPAPALRRSGCPPAPPEAGGEHTSVQGRQRRSYGVQNNSQLLMRSVQSCLGKKNVFDLRSCFSLDIFITDPKALKHCEKIRCCLCLRAFQECSSMQLARCLVNNCAQELKEGLLRRLTGAELLGFFNLLGFWGLLAATGAENMRANVLMGMK